MNNYYYIVASLPVLSHEWKPGAETPQSIRQDILEQCSGKDRQLVMLLEDGFVDGNLTPDFYRTALAHRNRFIREYFRFDLSVRNAKVRYLNRALGRDPEKDTVHRRSRSLPIFISVFDQYERRLGVASAFLSISESL